MASNTVIRTNILALNSHRNLGLVGAQQARSSQRLSSGYRINSAADDAAGLAISEKMRAQIRGLDMASRNTQDAISLIQTAEGGMQEIDNMLQRIRELIVYAANDHMDQDDPVTGARPDQGDRAKVQDEINQLMAEIDAMSHRVEFNRKRLISGDFSSTVEATFDQAGYNAARTAFISAHVAAAEPGFASAVDANPAVISFVSSGTSANNALSAANHDFASATTAANQASANVSAQAANLETARANHAELSAMAATGDAWGDISGVVGNQLGAFVDSANSAFNFMSANQGTLTDVAIASAIDALSELTGNHQSATTIASAFSAAEHFYSLGSGASAVSAMTNAFDRISAVLGQSGPATNAGLGFSADQIENYEDEFAELLISLEGQISRWAHDFDSIAAALDRTEAPPVPPGLSQASANVYAASNALSAAEDALAAANTQVVAAGQAQFAASGALAQANFRETEARAAALSGLEHSANSAAVYAWSGSFQREQALEGQTSAVEGMALWFQIGANAGQGMRLHIESVTTVGLGLSTSGNHHQDDIPQPGSAFVGSLINVVAMTGNIGDHAPGLEQPGSVHYLLNVLDTAQTIVATERSKLGAAENRLEFTNRSLQISSENLQSAESRVRDTDMGLEMMRLTQANILQQAAISMLAQGNMAPQAVLQLLG